MKAALHAVTAPAQALPPYVAIPSSSFASGYGGSGYLANAQYELTFATPYPGAYSVSVRFANGAYTATAHSGDHVTMRADGTYSVQ